MKTTTIRRAALSVAGLALAAASLTACGGDSDEASDAGSDTSASAEPSASESPTDEAETEDGAEEGDDAAGSAAGTEFCSIYGDLFQTVTESLGSGGGDLSAIIPELKDYADQLEEAGAPDDIPEDAERGFEVSIEAIQELPDDATQEDLNAASQDYSAEDQASAAAFGQYVITACPDLVPSGASVPSESPAS